MNLDLTNKTVLITGSSNGIGKSIAKAFHNEGCNVVLNGRNESSLQNTMKEFSDKASYFVADVTIPEQCRSLIDAVIRLWGKIDVLVCNVGSGSSVKPGDENLEEWKRVFDKNFFATTNMIEAASDSLATTHGSIVCISSIAGIEVTGAPLTYSAAKSALNSYVHGISRPLAKRGIRINAIAPGNILFKGSVWDKKLSENESAVNNMLKNEVALGRLGFPEEISNFVIFLASNLASFATGTVYVVDGGQLRS